MIVSHKTRRYARRGRVDASLVGKSSNADAFEAEFCRPYWPNKSGLHLGMADQKLWQRLEPCEEMVLWHLFYNLHLLISANTPVDLRHQLNHRFACWHECLEGAQIPAGIVYQVLCDRAYFNAIDQYFRKRHGWSRRNFRGAITAWIRIVTNSPIIQGVNAAYDARGLNIEVEKKG